MIECIMRRDIIELNDGSYHIMVDSVINKEELPVLPEATEFGVRPFVNFRIEKVIAKIPIASIGTTGVDPVLNIHHCGWTDCEFYLKGITY